MNNKEEPNDVYWKAVTETEKQYSLFNERGSSTVLRVRTTFYGTINSMIRK